MASNEKIQIDIGAKDAASPVIEKLASKIDGLESDEARIVVTADTKKLQDQLDRARIKLGTLTGDEYSVQARLVGSLEADVAQAKDLLDKLDGQTATVKIDSVGAKQGIDDLGKSADSSKSVLANMVGNATQDLGALGGVAGSAGVAIGQMGEYMADARAQGEGFGSILKNFAPIGGAIAGISIATAAFSDIMSKMAAGQAATKAFATDRIKLFTEAMREGKDVAEEYAGALEETGEVIVATGTKAGPAWTKILPGVREITGALGLMGKFGAEINDILPLLNKAGVQSEIWSEIVTSDAPVQAMAQLREALTQTTLSQDEQHKILIAARAEQDLYNESVANGTEMNKFFATSVIDVDGAIKNLVPSEEELKQAHDDAAAAAKNNADKVRELRDGFKEAESAADRLKTKNQELRDEISNDQFLLDLKDQWRDVEIAGDEAMQAAVDGTLDAGIKMDDYIQKQNDAKIALLDYRDELGTLPTEKVVPIIAQIDEGSFAEAERRMTILMRNREADLRIIANGGAGYGRLSGAR